MSGDDWFARERRTKTHKLESLLLKLIATFDSEDKLKLETCNFQFDSRITFLWDSRQRHAAHTYSIIVDRLWFSITSHVHVSTIFGWNRAVWQNFVFSFCASKSTAAVAYDLLLGKHTKQNDTVSNLLRWLMCSQSRRIEQQHSEVLFSFRLGLYLHFISDTEQTRSLTLVLVWLNDEI